MIRPALAFAALLCLLPPASASLSLRKDPLALSKEALRAARTSSPARDVRETAAPNAKDEFRITSQTEVLLNGRACQYQNVPAGSTISLIEVGPDRRTVLRIHFRSNGK